MDNTEITSESSNQSTSELNEDIVIKPTFSKRQRRQREDLQEKKEKAIKEMNYLLKNSQKYSNFFMQKLTADRKHTLPQFNNNMTETDLHNPKESDDSVENIDIGIKNFVGTLHPYQIEGLKWLKLLYENSINGILADEMGLGKTIQVIALICNLLENNIPGPYLIVAPLSTLLNWMAEFKRFAPKIPVILFHGDKEQRQERKYEMRRKYRVDTCSTSPVIITSYDYPVKEFKFLSQFRWQYLIIDEGHRIKNYQCRLICALKKLVTSNRLILTGTPLQNNLLELWSLLNFLLPQIFPNAETFSSLFEIEDFEETHKIIQQEQNTNIISTIHGVLGPFMLRRLKSDVLTLVPKKEVMVYCPLTDFQKELYTYVLQRNIAKLTGKECDENDNNTIIHSRKKRKCTIGQCYVVPTSDDEFEVIEEFKEIDKNFRDNFLASQSSVSITDKKKFLYNIKLTNAMIMLQKIVNHPFTVHTPVDEETQVVINEDIVSQSGKMLVLDAMLPKLKEGGHKVLLFCSMTQILDFIEDYMIMRDYKYCRLDGTIQLEDRQNSIDSFNTDPDVFVFLISTRAGGLGVNLTQADTVIFFDRDWNPQVDIQAQDRCHRIGQTKPVMVYSLITKATIDERIVTRANSKRRLEKIVIKKGKFSNPEDKMKTVLDLNELKDLLNSVHNGEIVDSNAIFSEQELANLLDRSELYQQMVH